MFREIVRPAISLFVLLSLVTGIIYPLAVTGVAQLLWPAKANGSLIVRDGAVVGSELVGQAFDDPKYFWGRPSATSPVACNAAASGGSHLGPSTPARGAAVRSRVAALRSADPDNTAPIPVDLVTCSASGLDPHISPAAAHYQVGRVARARGLDEETLRRLIARHTQGRTLGLLGEPRVNVVELNLDLDASHEREPARP